LITVPPTVWEALGEPQEARRNNVADANMNKHNPLLAFIDTSFIRWRTLRYTTTSRRHHAAVVWNRSCVVGSAGLPSPE
jgi:hypothetical protein